MIIAGQLGQDGREVHLDVAVVDPASKSYRREAAVYPGHAARYIEKRKAALYDPTRGRVVPFVMESMGRLGPIALNFIREVSVLAQDRVQFAGSRFANYWKRRLCLSLIRAKAAVAEQRFAALYPQHHRLLHCTSDDLDFR